MTGSFGEQAYLRRALFALEVLDAVTLERVTRGLKVVAEGLRGTPVVNASGIFVWLEEDTAALRRVTVDPGILPFEGAELAPDEVRPRQLNTVVLSPRVSYPFSGGITGLRGTLIEERLPSPQRPVPVPNAAVQLRWLDEDGTTWRDAPTVSHTDEHGDFAAIVRLAPTQVPRVDAEGAMTVRLRARRPAPEERGSGDLRLLQGRVADPPTFPQGRDALTFAWDELQP
jgi:hypothetical protein